MTKKNEAKKAHLRWSALVLLVSLGALAGACGTGGDASDDTSASATEDDSSEPASRFLTSNVVFNQEGPTSYINVLDSLTKSGPDPGEAQEFPGWADLWVHQGSVFISDGESPEMARYVLNGADRLTEKARVSFQNYGAGSAAFWSEVFVGQGRAYWFNTVEREVVVWDTKTLEIVSSFSFDLPELADREGGLLLAGPSADRASVVRGSRAFVPFYWANWDDYSLSEDSVVLVIDTESDEVLDVLSVPCPEINFASLDSDQTLYLSSWGYAAIPSVLDGKRSACAVRILEGSEELDPDWSLTFADVTEGREASALRALGDGTALITVFHDERADITGDVDRFALTDSSNWRLWSVDLALLPETQSCRSGAAASEGAS